MDNYIGNGKIQREKLSIEISRDREKKKHHKEIQKMEVYNNVLRVDGEHLMIVHVGGHYTEMEIDTYTKEIRPLLYQHLHIIDSDVASIIKSIDYEIAKCNFNEEITAEENIYLSKKYFKLIDYIINHIDGFREKNFADS